MLYWEDKMEWWPLWYNLRRIQATQTLISKGDIREGTDDFRQLIIYIKDSVATMAETRKKQGKKNGFTRDVKWITVTLVAEDVDEAAEWCESKMHQSAGLLAGVATAGFSISLKRRDDGDYMATIIGDVPWGNDTRTVGYTARADTALAAIMGILWKHYVYLSEGADAESVANVSSGLFS